MIRRSGKLEYDLISSLERDPLFRERLRRLRTVPGVGSITALTWALEIGDYTRFSSNKQAISYCGLCADERSSADKTMRMPLSKQRNKHIQKVLVEAAKLAPRESPELAMIRAPRDGERKSQPGDTGSGEKDGLLHDGGRAQAAGFRACRRMHPDRGGLKTFPDKGKTKTSGSTKAQAARSR